MQAYINLPNKPRRRKKQPDMIAQIMLHQNIISYDVSVLFPWLQDTSLLSGYKCTVIIDSKFSETQQTKKNYGANWQRMPNKEGGKKHM